MRSTLDAQHKRWGLTLAAITLAASLAGQAVVTAYHYGRLSARVDNVERMTRQLLDLQLQNSYRAQLQAEERK